MQLLSYRDSSPTSVLEVKTFFTGSSTQEGRNHKSLSLAPSQLGEGRRKKNTGAQDQNPLFPQYKHWEPDTKWERTHLNLPIRRRWENISPPAMYSITMYRFELSCDQGAETILEVMASGPHLHPCRVQATTALLI